MFKKIMEIDVLSAGWIYIMSNPSFRGMVKIGYTTLDPTQRALELQTTGVPTPFKIEYQAYVSNCEELEVKIHRLLSRKRVGKNREFFRLSQIEAIDFVKEQAKFSLIEDQIHFKTREERRIEVQQHREQKEADIKAKAKREEWFKYRQHVENYLDELQSHVRSAEMTIKDGFKKKIRQHTLPFSSKRKTLLMRANYFWEDYSNISDGFFSNLQTYLLSNPKYFNSYEETRWEFKFAPEKKKTEKYVLVTHRREEVERWFLAQSFDFELSGYKLLEKFCNVHGLNLDRSLKITKSYRKIL